MSGTYLLRLGEDRYERICRVARDSDLSMAEVLRRVIDLGLSEESLNRIVPHLSGQWR